MCTLRGWRAAVEQPPQVACSNLQRWLVACFSLLYPVDFRRTILGQHQHNRNTRPKYPISLGGIPYFYYDSRSYTRIHLGLERTKDSLEVSLRLYSCRGTYSRITYSLTLIDIIDTLQLTCSMYTYIAPGSWLDFLFVLYLCGYSKRLLTLSRSGGETRRVKLRSAHCKIMSSDLRWFIATRPAILLGRCLFERHVPRCSPDQLPPSSLHCPQTRVGLYIPPPSSPYTLRSLPPSPTPL